MAPKGFFKKTALKRRNRFKKSTAAKVRTLAKVVRTIMPEVKYSDMFSVSQYFQNTPTSAYVIQPLSNITQGDSDVNNRIGDTIHLKYMRIKGSFINNDTIPLNCRIIVVKVKQNIESLLTGASVGNAIMESAYSTTVNAVEAPYDNDNSGGIVKLADRRYVINPSVSAGNAATVWPQVRPFSMNIKLNCKSEFLQGGTTSTKNGIFIFFISSGYSAYQYCTYVIRTTYLDS